MRVTSMAAMPQHAPGTPDAGALRRQRNALGVTDQAKQTKHAHLARLELRHLKPHGVARAIRGRHDLRGGDLQAEQIGLALKRENRGLIDDRSRGNHRQPPVSKLLHESRQNARRRHNGRYAAKEARISDCIVKHRGQRVGRYLWQHGQLADEAGDLTRVRRKVTDKRVNFALIDLL